MFEYLLFLLLELFVLLRIAKKNYKKGKLVELYQKKILRVYFETLQRHTCCCRAWQVQIF